MAKKMKAEFIISNTDFRMCPQVKEPEYAFIGRSNVGKSSLINMLTNHKGLAKTSAKPGKTLLINHFMVTDEESKQKRWYIVDLPGYGYAKLGKNEQEKLRRLIMGYVLNRTQMTLLFVLLDCRLEPQAIDLEFIRTLGSNGIPFALVFTKLDKLSNAQWQRNFEAYKERLLEEWEELPTILETSSEKKTGRDELLAYIREINNNLDKE